MEKGIAEYKKQQKAKARAADKARKQARRAKARDAEEAEEVVMEGAGPASSGRVAWALLVLSWAGFAAYLLLS